MQSVSFNGYDFMDAIPYSYKFLFSIKVNGYTLFLHIYRETTLSNSSVFLLYFKRIRVQIIFQTGIGAQWFSGKVLDSRGCGFEPHLHNQTNKLVSLESVYNHCT